MSTETKTLTNADAKIQPKLGVKALVQIGMLSAIAIILMMFEIPLPFAPTFYKIDLSEVPVLVGCFAMGPMAGVLVELVKILLNLVMTGTSTAGVGEIANFIIGCSFCVPAGLIYRKNRTRKSALIGMATGTLLMIVIGCFVDSYFFRLMQKHSECRLMHWLVWEQQLTHISQAFLHLLCLR